MNNSTPLCAVIPTFVGKKRWLINTLASLRAQSRPPDMYFIGVDVKQIDDVEAFSDVSGPDTHITYMAPPSRWKRQHEIINALVNITPEKSLLVVMDDDYWMGSRECISRLLAAWTPDSITFPSEATHVKGPIAQTGQMFADFGSIHLFGDGITITTRRCTSDPQGQHPMCGHPKIIGRDLYQRSGGFNTDRFKHYFCGDTEFHLRLQRRFSAKFVAVENVPVYHMDHERDSCMAFHDQNMQALRDLAGFFQEI